METTNPLTTDEITAHEDERELLWELVLGIPDRVVLLFKVLPEIWNGHGLCVLIGVCLLPIVHHKCPEKENRQTLQGTSTNKQLCSNTGCKQGILFHMFEASMLVLCQFCNYVIMPTNIFATDDFPIVHKQYPLLVGRTIHLDILLLCSLTLQPC